MLREIVRAFARNWWLILIRGIVAILFGLVAILWPDLTVTALVILFGAFALVDGAFTAGAAIAGAMRGRRWVMQLVSGLLGMLLGIVVLVWPDVTVVALAWLIAAWALLIGVLQIVAAIRLREVIIGEWLMFVSGVLAVLLAAVLIISPIGSIITLAIVAGAFAVIFGIGLIAVALRLKRWHDQLGETAI